MTIYKDTAVNDHQARSTASHWSVSIKSLHWRHLLLLEGQCRGGMHLPLCTTDANLGQLQPGSQIKGHGGFGFIHVPSQPLHHDHIWPLIGHPAQIELRKLWKWQTVSHYFMKAKHRPANIIAYHGNAKYQWPIIAYGMFVYIIEAQLKVQQGGGDRGGGDREDLYT